MTTVVEEDRFVAVATLDRWALRRALAAWGLLDLADLQGSFQDAVLPLMLGSLIEAQESAAEIGGAYVADAVPEGAVKVSPSAFSGIASDGRDLASLLTQPLIQAFVGLSRGVPTTVALNHGAELLDQIVTTQVQDVARQAESVALVSNVSIKGYLRNVEPGACGRCVILAGRFYKWNDGFDRHPKCRCSHTVLTRKSEPQSPLELFNGMSKADQDRAFPGGGAEAIRLGADPAQVQNARLGMSTATVGGRKVATTTVGTGKRSYYTVVRRAIDTQRGASSNFSKKPGSRYQKITRPRLLPEEIIRAANGDRATARRLLISNGYVVGNVDRLVAEIG